MRASLPGPKYWRAGSAVPAGGDWYFWKSSMAVLKSCAACCRKASAAALEPLLEATSCVALRTMRACLSSDPTDQWSRMDCLSCCGSVPQGLWPRMACVDTMPGGDAHTAGRPRAWDWLMAVMQAVHCVLPLTPNALAGAPRTRSSRRHGVPVHATGSALAP